MAAVVSRGQITTLSGPSPIGIPVVDPGVPLEAYSTDAGIVPEHVWYTQPSVRKVVDFIARAVASTPLKAYRRVSDTDRQRITDGPLAAVLAQPAPGLTPFRAWHQVLVDWLLFDRWCMSKAASLEPARGLDLIRIPARRFRLNSDGLGRVSTIWIGGLQDYQKPDGFVFDAGYSPQFANGVTPIRTLDAILQESSEAVEYRRSVWKNGGRIPAVIERPVNTPWGEGALERFRSGWSAYTRGGGREGGTPILEDGMKLSETNAFTPRDTQDILGRQLNDVEVSSAYHIAPELVGARQGNYSNVQAFRDMLYGDALGPYFAAFEQVLNVRLVPDLAGPDVYVEFDVDAKLRGSFQDQAQILSTAVGAPWMLRAEARAFANLPYIAGSEQLVTPLNVIEGGQASPRDTGSQNTGKARFKARAGGTYEKRAAQVLARFFEKQRDAVLAAIPGKAAADWWDGQGWDQQLSDALFGLSTMVADQIGQDAAETLGFTPDDYDPARTVKFLRAVADTHAANINATTKQQLDDALASDDLTADSVFALALNQRAPSAATQLVTSASAFGTTEAARQLSNGTATKTWETGPHPRPSHAQMNGETVGLDEAFSNGLDRPGDLGDPDEVAGCNCSVSVTIP